ncbi:MAG TPA: cupin domain-containing protein [Sphingomicrobium sp.]|nr:cupin domain-containing protein [Sphingomicrobium sp.]
MKGYHDDIERQTVENDDFRRVLYTGKNLQLVLMSLPPGCDIGSEVHDDRDQFFRFEEGRGQVEIDDNTYDVADGSGIIVPAGARHNVRNTGDGPLKLYTLYGPPEHKDGIVQSTKEEAAARHAHEEWDGNTTER